MRHPKKLIERAYTEGEALGLSVWTEDEAGPFQAIPQMGSGWHEGGRPGRLPHEYIRGGMAKLLTLFHPATGTVRAEGTQSSANAVLQRGSSASPPRSSLSCRLGRAGLRRRRSAPSGRAGTRGLRFGPPSPKRCPGSGCFWCWTT